MNRTALRLALMTGVVSLAACVPVEERIQKAQSDVDVKLSQATPAPTARPAASGDVRVALRKAVEGNGEFRAALAAQTEALAYIGMAQSQQRPQLSSTTMAGKVYEGSPSDDVITGASLDLILSQVVFDGGATRAGIDEATARAVAAQAGAAEVGNSVALEAYRAWVNLWLAQEQMGLLNDRSGEFSTIADQLDRLTESGMVDSSLREGARLAELDISMERSRLQGDLRAREAAFLRYFDAVPAKLPRPASLVDGKGLTPGAEDWKNAPSLRRIAAELLAAEAATDGAKAAFKPVVSLNTALTSPMDPDDTTDTTVGFQVRYTLGDGGKRKAQVAAAEAREEALRAQLQDAQAEAQSLLASSLAGLKALEGSSSLVSEKVSASASKAETAQAQIALGQSNLSALMEAQISNYRATEQELQMIAERLILQAEIAAGTGQLLASLGLSAEAPTVSAAN